SVSDLCTDSSSQQLTLRASLALSPYSLCSCDLSLSLSSLFFFNDTATTEIYTLSLHDALPISGTGRAPCSWRMASSDFPSTNFKIGRAPSELQSHLNLVCRLLLEKKNKKTKNNNTEELYN